MSDSIPSTQADPPVPMASLTPPELPAPKEASPAKKPGKKPRAKRTTTLDSMVSRLMTLSPECKGMSVAEIKKAVARGYDTDGEGTSLKLSLKNIIRARRNRSQKSSAGVSKRATPESSEAPGEKKPPAKSSKSMSTTKKTTGKKVQGSEKPKGAKGKPPGKIPANAPAAAEKPKGGRPRLSQQKKANPGQVTSKK